MKHATMLVALALAACSFNRAANNDAAVDTLVAPTGDAPPGAVVVALATGGAPVPGAVVYFQDPDSTIRVAALTDKNGTVGALVAPGGFVTIVHPPSGTNARALTTFAGVQANDVLRVDLAPVDKRTAIVLGVVVPVFAGAAAYQVRTSCGEVDLGPSGVDMAAQLIGCGGTTDAVVIATDDAAAPLAALFATGVAVADGGMLAPSGTYQSLASTTLGYANVPDFVSFLGIDRGVVDSGARLVDMPGNALPSGGTANATVALPDAPGTTTLTATVAFPVATEAAEQTVYDWAPNGSAYAIDLGAALLAAYAAAPSFDASARAVVWQERPGVAPDFVRARVRASRDVVPAPVSWTWRIVAPRGAAPAIALPVLPRDGFDFNIASDDAVAIEELTSVALPGGYDSFRTRGFDAVTEAIGGASGRIVVEVPYAPDL